METTKVFKSGNSQAIRLPKAYQLQAKELYINKIGSALIVLPKDDPWLLFNQSLPGFSADFLAKGRRQPKPQKRKLVLR
jgi:antitoxin VapB